MARRATVSSVKRNVARVVGRGPSGGRASVGKTQSFGGLGRTAKSAARALRGTTGNLPTPSSQTASFSVTATAASNLVNRASHGFPVGTRVRFSAMTGGAGLTAGTDYWIIESGYTANAFKVSALRGGAEVDITTDMTAGTITRHSWGA